MHTCLYTPVYTATLLTSLHKEEIGGKRIFQRRLFTEIQTLAKVNLIQVTTVGTPEFQSLKLLIQQFTNQMTNYSS